MAKVAPERLVFVDECGTHTSMAPIYGYATHLDAQVSYAVYGDMTAVGPSESVVAQVTHHAIGLGVSVGIAGEHSCHEHFAMMGCQTGIFAGSAFICWVA